MACASCSNDLDSIKKVAPGEDTAAPEVTIQYPSEGTVLRVVEDVTDININCDVTDDIELKKIEVALDGTSIKTVETFTDYRRDNVRFNYDKITSGDHTLSVTAEDLTGKKTTQTVNFSKAEPYRPKFDGEVMYFPFDGSYIELISVTEATAVGSPSFGGEAKMGLNSYVAAENSYITFPASRITANKTCSFTFWYKLNMTPDRGSLLVLGDNDQGPTQERSHGFRIFREAAGVDQKVKANVGTGSSDSWCDGITLSNSEWKFIAVVISETQVSLYCDAELIASASLPEAIDWTNCNELTVLSGGQSFSYWGHAHDASMMDELRGFNKALSLEEIQAIMAAI